MTIQNTLPDPLSSINEKGEAALGSYGPGFASITVESVQPVLTTKSRSGISFRQINSFHEWDVSIKYNPLTKAQFNTVYGFLLKHQANLEPFLVGLPQHYKPSVLDKEITSTAEAGSSTLTIANTTGVEVGDMFYIADPGDDTHVKAYQVTTIPTSTSITISPSLQKKVLGNTSADAVFAYPKIQVITDSDSISYSINTNGLYSLSLKLKECLV